MLKKSLKKTILINIGAFVLVFTLELLSNLYFRDKFETSYAFFSHTIEYVIMIMGIIWVNHFLLIPYFLDKKRYFLYVILLIGGLLAFSYIRANSWSGVSKVFFFLLYTTGAGMAAFLFRRNLMIQKRNSEKEKLQREMELNYLKEQVNPHFLFNSLNSIYALSRQQSPETPDVVMQLSELMRYQLESSKKDTVLLKEELEFIENYLLLEEKRLSNRSTIEFSIEGDVSKLRISPMLLIPFVENAIKHGAQSTNEQSTISACATVKDSMLHFKICNSKPNSHTVSKREGFGLENVRRRLKLLYPNSHTLEINDTEEAYYVNLSIDLNTQ
ncbi:Histidine kinase [Tenacibaculum sp. 190130A14a]|uniref:Two-component system, LytTR family, sensor kinase n=1 Tax=Tenacibaculum polynesiense TaxID=3137857 RepID=A0ABM9PCF4_9FLAO